MKKPKGRFIGVGVGPGDPELITLKALRRIQSAMTVSYLTNAKGSSQAKDIAVEAFESVDHDQDHIGIMMPMSMDRNSANLAYDAGAFAIRKALDKGQDVVFLCEGDPLFFGSFAYLMERLENSYECEVVPGVSSIHAAASALKHPLTMQKESFTVVSGRHSDAQIEQALTQHDSVVIMKAGRERPRILSLLRITDRIEDAQYLEYIGRENELICKDVANLSDEVGPYFSLFVITRSAFKRDEP
ncbi:precorrin-2 C(20)-methyltransferase [Marinomonas sp. 15G1-11]|uniref:Precorrin-2 C(20)-methyltransferase n=1 Tax=Marinomonas phaeophyticola TaxID=3004091 RepID=A0ABT4JY43_9GAMM|nr:precorrin-2 C(20)-methyltransferase [Marinomonas sp. 15G1-11]MCZ2723146.1 precorrin-2 C(20)-methyltransferase [Marinomonas sp. 15G1-11]